MLIEEIFGFVFLASIAITLLFGSSEKYADKKFSITMVYVLIGEIILLAGYYLIPLIL